MNEEEMSRHDTCVYNNICVKFSEDLSVSDSSEDAYYDPALFGIMGALALMFIIMCVVLQLFARLEFFIF